MKIDFTKINLSHKDIYKEIKRLGIELELKDEYKYLEDKDNGNQN